MCNSHWMEKISQNEWSCQRRLLNMDTGILKEFHKRKKMFTIKYLNNKIF
jgi:hypothetical protein